MIREEKKNNHDDDVVPPLETEETRVESWFAVVNNNQK